MAEDEQLTQGRRRSTFSGLMFTLCILAVVVVGVVAVSKWRSSGLVYTIEFKDAKGLQPGDKVELSGIPIGEVRKVELLEDAKVLVSVRIDDNSAQKVKQNSTAVIASRTFPNVSGQKVIEIHNPAGKKGEPIRGGSKIQGKENLFSLKAWDLHGQMDSLSKDASGAARTAAEKMSALFEELKDIPESPEVKHAMERLNVLSQELREKGKDAAEEARREWELFSQMFGPTLQEWKKSGREKSAEKLNSLLDLYERKKQELLKGLNRPSAPASRPASESKSEKI